MIFADKLIRLRKKSGMSQEELAEKMNVSRQSVSKWEGAQSVPDLEKILQLSKLFGVTIDYLLKDELEDEEFVEKDTERCRKITLAQANEFLELRKKASWRIALATFLNITAIAQLIIFGGTTTLSEPPLPENTAGVLGIIVMFVLAAVAVGIYLYTGAQSRHFEFLEKEPFETEYGVVGMVKERQKAYRDTYVRSNIIGTCLCIISPVLLFIGAMSDTEFFTVMMFAATLLIAGVGVVFFITAGVREASMRKLLQDGDYTPKRKRRARLAAKVSPIYWSITIAIYLFWLLFIDSGKYESQSWVVFPVAGVLFAAVLGVCGLIERGGNNDER
ncbi:MAG: helix-turn-helix domain-containing protein [Oscillospiraceae bacterium]|nr:helix-turn-helix domain-containing protein [Oscillospiraceae bacterium]